jgi:hypothetical protein
MIFEIKSDILFSPQVVRRGYKSVVMLNLVDSTIFATPSVQNLTTEWKFLSENVYNNTKLQLELVSQE